MSNRDLGIILAYINAGLAKGLSDSEARTMVLKIRNYIDVVLTYA